MRARARRLPIGRPAPRSPEVHRRPRRMGLRGRREPIPSPVLTGVDLTPAPRRRRRVQLRPGAGAVVAAGAVCAALLLVALRMDSIRLRYRLADAVRAEQEALDQQRRLTVDVRHLRHPLRLEALGRELGLAPAGCMIDLAAPRPCPEPAP
jgi:hypothetical protein